MIKYNLVLYYMIYKLEFVFIIWYNIIVCCDLDLYVISINWYCIWYDILLYYIIWYDIGKIKLRLEIVIYNINCDIYRFW